jgi:hypothetical protein
MFAAGTAEILVAGRRAAVAFCGAEGLEVPGLVLAGAVSVGLLACGGMEGGFGAKYLAQSKITTMDSSEASTMRTSWLSLLFFNGSLTNGPLPV